MPARFVILQHRLADGEHWDLMLEDGEKLLTWQLLKEPVDASSLPMPARRIGDHRKAYLEYEGPVSRGRGIVERIDAGSLTIVSNGPDGCEIRLSGERLHGAFRLIRLGGDEWVLKLA